MMIMVFVASTACQLYDLWASLFGAGLPALTVLMWLPCLSCVMFFLQTRTNGGIFILALTTVH